MPETLMRFSRAVTRVPPPRTTTTAPGTYQVDITASNNDVEPQTDVCTLTVTVTPIRTIGEVQGSVGDAADGLTHRSPFAPPAGNAAGQQVFVRGVVTQLGTIAFAYGFRQWLGRRYGGMSRAEPRAMAG